MFRRSLAMLLCVCMVFSMLPTSAFAVETNAGEEQSVVEQIAEPQSVSEEPKPEEPQPVSEEPKPEAPQPVSEEPKPEEPQPVSEEPKPEAPQSVSEEPKSEALQPVSEESQSVELQPVEPETDVSEPVESQPEESQPVESQPTESEPVESQPEEQTEEKEPEYKSLTVGQTITLVASGEAGGTWESQDSAVATVSGRTDDQGRTVADVTGVAQGSATVTYTVGESVEKWVVTVAAAVEETAGPSEGAGLINGVLDSIGGLLGDNMLGLDDGISTYAISANKTTIAVGESVTLTGSSNEIRCGYNQTWESSDSSVATLSNSWGRVSVTGQKPGTVTITHTYYNNDRW